MPDLWLKYTLAFDQHLLLNSQNTANFLAMVRHALILKITYDNDEDDDDEEEEKEENVDAGV